MDLFDPVFVDGFDDHPDAVGIHFIAHIGDAVKLF